MITKLTGGWLDGLKLRIARGAEPAARFEFAQQLLAALACFVWAERAGARAWPRYLLAGALAGLAGLAHIYGAAALMVIGLALLWRAGWRLPREPEPWLVAAGCALALLPWGLYLARDPASYAGQMLPERARFQLWDAHFYLAVTFEKMGLSQEARPHWTAYRSLAPQGEWVELAKEFSD